MAGDHCDHAQEEIKNARIFGRAFGLTPISAVPTVMVEPAVMEIVSVLPVEPMTIVFIIPAIAVMAMPFGIIIVIVAGIIPFRDAVTAVFANLRISCAGCKAAD